MSRRDRILVLDEDRAIRQAAKVLLEAEGFEVWPCSTEYDALVYLHCAGIDAAVIDLDMPLHAGFRVLDEALRHEELDRCALVAVAFDVRKVDLDQVDHAVGKPYATLELAPILRGVIAEHRAGFAGEEGGE